MVKYVCSRPATPPCGREEGTKGQEVFNTYVTGAFCFFAVLEVSCLGMLGPLCGCLPCQPAASAPPHLGCAAVAPDCSACLRAVPRCALLLGRLLASTRQGCMRHSLECVSSAHPDSQKHIPGLVSQPHNWIAPSPACPQAYSLACKWAEQLHLQSLARQLVDQMAASAAAAAAEVAALADPAAAAATAASAGATAAGAPAAAAAAGSAAATAAAAGAAAGGMSSGGPGFIFYAVAVLVAGATICKTISQTVEQRG